MFAVINLTSLFTILFLVFLEGILSVDNALVLALLVRHLPPEQRKKALTYGIWGAFGFRFLALFCLTWLMKWHWVSAIGGIYLLYMGLSGLLSSQKEKEMPQGVLPIAFWRTIVLVEFMDISFSADSILASLSVSDNYWILLLGGILGIITMRLASVFFVWLIDKFPKMEHTAYFLVIIMGVKMMIQGLFYQIDFHSVKSPAAWGFWCAMILAIAYGLKHKEDHK